MDIRNQSGDWAGLLQDFTQRNTGRRTRLEIDDPELGAQWQEVDLPLLGVAYDPRDGRIEVIVGKPGGPRLTHSVGGVTEVDIQRAHGADQALRLAHAPGQTLLRLVG